MNEYIVARKDLEWYVQRHVGETYAVIATCPSREYAEQIAEALNPNPVDRLGWDDLEQIANQRGR